MASARTLGTLEYLRCRPIDYYVFFGHARTCRIQHGMTFRQAFDSYLELYGLDEGDFDYSEAKNAYNSLHNVLRQGKKCKGC